MKAGILSLKNKIIFLLIIILLFCGFSVYGKSNVEFLNCCILKKAYNSGSFSENVTIKVITADSKEQIFDCGDKVTVNGQSYKNAEDIFSAVSENSFADIAVEDNVVTVLNFNSNYESYSNVEYSKIKGFSELNYRQNKLPVYRKYNNSFVPPYLDNNHYYDIDVYDNAICITNMTSKNNVEAINLTQINNGIDGNFNQNIYVYCETDSSDSIIKGELYDKNNILVRTAEVNENELYFSDLDNVTATYKIKLWVEDNNGIKISNDYYVNTTVQKAEIKNLAILSKGFSSEAFYDNVELKSTDTNGSEEIYSLASRVCINKKWYNNTQEIYNAIFKNSFADAAIENGKIKVINFSTISQQCKNATYDNGMNVNGTKISNLPIYYSHNNSYTKPYLDNNHYYDIDVYDNAICITNMTSKNNDVTIQLIETNAGINGNFKKDINVYCETDTNENYILKGELYKANKCICTSENDCYTELSFSDLDNVTATYKIKLWVEDNNGVKISNDYYVNTTVQKAEIKNSVISDKSRSSDTFEETVMLKGFDTNGNETVYDCADKVYINDTLCKDSISICNAVETGVFADAAIENGLIVGLKFNNTKVQYENVTYDNGIFSEIGATTLPVYYQYENSFVPPYLDNNHYYDINVYDNAICITNMRSKDNDVTIKFIETDTGINSNFKKDITVYCETDSNENYILRGVLYNRKNHKISTAKVEMRNWGELIFENTDNKSEDCVIKIRLEDENGYAVSNVYVINKKLQKNEIKYGSILFKYDIDDNEDGFLLKIRDIDGKENVYFGNSETKIANQTAMNFARSGNGEIEENSFVKFALNGDTVSQILTEPEGLDLISSDFTYSCDITGNICILNQTDKLQKTDCYAVIYDNNDCVKQCAIIPVTVEAEDVFSLTPDFSGYKYSSGDYIKIFLWEENGIKPLLETTYANIISQ